MKIAILGASGKIGNLLLEKASKNENFEVTGFTRKPLVLENTKIINKDIFTLTTEDVAEFDAIISGFAVWNNENMNDHTKLIKHLSSIIKPETRLIIVGGAGSLFVDKEHTTKLLETPNFPEEYMAVAKATSDSYDYLKTLDNILWTYFSPAAVYDYEGENNKSYIIGNDELILNNKNNSYLTYKDSADIILEELLNKNFIQKRFTAVSNEK